MSWVIRLDSILHRTHTYLGKGNQLYNHPNSHFVFKFKTKADAEFVMQESSSQLVIDLKVVEVVP